MIEEISKIRGDSSLFPGPQLEMVLSSIAAGNTHGRLWRVCDEESDALYLLWDQGNNVFYLSGDPVAVNVQALSALLQTEIRQTAIKLRRVYFKVHPLSAACKAAIPKLFPHIHLHETRKLFYRFEKETVYAPTAQHADIRYECIDAAFLNQEQFENMAAVKAEVEWMWSSPQAYRAHGFGFVALVGDVIVCWCTAEYVSERMCGIGIETIANYQNQGIASATAAHFVGECLRRRITPHWECDQQNFGSKRVAEKVGFELLQETVVWSGYFGR